MTYTGREATPGTILTIISFGLLLIVNLITPIIKTLHFVKILRKSTSEELTIGLWGYCAQNSGESRRCTSPKIGFAFDASTSLNPNLAPDLPGAVNIALSYLTVVHIVALITLSIVTCVGAFAHTRKNRDRGLIRVAAQSSALAFVFVLFAFIVDFILFNNGIVKPINNKAGSVYLAEFDIAYYLVIACLVSSGLATISFFVGRIMNKRRRKSEESSSFDDSKSEDFRSEQRISGFRDQNVPKFAEFEEDVVEADPIKQSTPHFPLGSQPGQDYYYSPMRPPNPPQPYPMGPYQGYSSRPTSPNERSLPPSPPGIPPQQQFSYPLSSQSSYHNAYNSYSTTSPSYPPDSYPFPSNQSPILSHDTYPNSNNSNIYPPQSSHHWGQTQPHY
ncbi:SUR7/PalI family-domain-containing protein [Rhizophagus diaphanus]|nr:SUR7/PalI family-domain-containing protein [Rhizophagus diaphanus] [Rhizophagus sp. MUCL 43196]